MKQNRDAFWDHEGYEEGRGAAEGPDGRFLLLILSSRRRRGEESTTGTTRRPASFPAAEPRAEKVGHGAADAWYGENSDGRTHPVGRKLPNPWGLHDIHGNVWEWCRDRYGDYLGGIAVDPQGPVTGSHDSFRVVRGGNWLNWEGGARYCRSAYRVNGVPDSGSPDRGFRAVLVPGQP